MAGGGHGHGGGGGLEGLSAVGLCFIMGIAIYSLKGNHIDQEARAPREVETPAPTQEQASPVSHARRPRRPVPIGRIGAPGRTSASAGVLPAITGLDEVCPEGLTLVTEHHARSGIPRGYLLSHWKKESGFQCGGQAGNYLAGDLLKPGSACRDSHPSKKDPEYCDRQFRALTAICAQRKGDGTLVCDDPHNVRVAAAMEVGVFQSQPTNIMRLDEETKRFVHSDHATDHDGDGAVDPFSLADSMATAVGHLLKNRERATSDRKWREASIAYNGKESYYDGPNGIRDNWSRICEELHCQ